MNFKRFILCALVFGVLSFGTIAAYGVLSFGTIAAYGQSSEPQPEQETYLVYGITALTFIAAGVFYAVSGYIKKIRRKLAGDTTVKLDYQKMGKTTLIGVILGIGAFIMSTYNGDTISVSTMHEFFVQVGLNMAAILIIDKWVLGRSEDLNAPKI